MRITVLESPLDMPELLLPQGESPRVIAERLGVSVEELCRHANIVDPEAPLHAARPVTVPDGFLRARHQQTERERLTQSAMAHGMNGAMMATIEHRRAQRDGGVHAHAPTADEQQALAEAWRAFRRFEPDSNELAEALFVAQLRSPSVATRAEAAAGASMASANRTLIFGDTRQAPALQAISWAKAAVHANPKLSLAHVAASKSCRAHGHEGDITAALQAAERALELDPECADAWCELAAGCLVVGERTDAIMAAERALELDPQQALAHELLIRLFVEGRALERAEASLQQLMQTTPTFANAGAWSAVFHSLRGRSEADILPADHAIDGAAHPAYARVLRHIYDSFRQPRGATSTNDRGVVGGVAL